MTIDEKKVLIQGLINSLVKSNGREENLKKELSDDKMTLKSVQEMIIKGDAVPVDCGYESLEAWKTTIEKETLAGIKSLANIEEQKIEVEALKFYIEKIA
ncbi:MAG: hypothetical protein ACRC54_01840 [Fusobacteriaceae bacterium]